MAVHRPPLPLPIRHPFLSSSSKSQSCAEWKSPGGTQVHLSLVALRPLELPHGCGLGHRSMSGSSHKGALSTGRLLPPPKQVGHFSPRERFALTQHKARWPWSATPISLCPSHHQPWPSHRSSALASFPQELRSKQTKSWGSGAPPWVFPASPVWDAVEIWLTCFFMGTALYWKGYFSNPRLVKGGRLTPHLSLLQTHTGRQVPLA